MYETAKILHRDISTNNIMFYRHPKDGAIGVLCDWDLAKKLDKDLTPDDIVTDTIRCRIPKQFCKPNVASLKDTQPAIQHPSGAPVAVEDSPGRDSPKYRTGTGPFMALDLLLYKQAPHHLYRHDLESFFFVLAWFVATFNPATHTLGIIPDWLHSHLEMIGESKKKAVQDPDIMDAYFSESHEDYENLADTWVSRLVTNVIEPLSLKYTLISAEIGKIWKANKANKMLMSEEKRIDLVFDTVKESIIEREKVLTYDTFVACLND